jgi:hypothetical protein
LANSITLWAHRVDEKCFERVSHIPIPDIKADCQHASDSVGTPGRLVSPLGAAPGRDTEIATAIPLKAAPEAMVFVLRLALACADTDVDDPSAAEERIASWSIVIGDVPGEGPLG